MVYTLNSINKDLKPLKFDVYNIVVDGTEQLVESQREYKYPNVDTKVGLMARDPGNPTEVAQKRCPWWNGTSCKPGGYFGIGDIETLTFRGIATFTNTDDNNKTQDYAQFKSSCTGRCIKDYRSLFVPVKTLEPKKYEIGNDKTSLIHGLSKDGKTLTIFDVPDYTDGHVLYSNMRPYTARITDASTIETTLKSTITGTPHNIK